MRLGTIVLILMMIATPAMAKQPPQELEGGTIVPEAHGALSPEFVAIKEAVDQMWLAAIDELQHRVYGELIEAELARRVVAVTRVQPRASSSCGGNVECFLQCTIQHESASAGVYGAVSPGGTYRGAYQFDQGTWNSSANGAGYGQYAGVPANQVPPEVQDAVAAYLYSQRGNQPWGGRC